MYYRSWGHHHPLLLLCGALLAAEAVVERRCTEITEGLLDSEPVALDPLKVPAYVRRYNLDIPQHHKSCGDRVLSGLVVTACDVLPPQVDMQDTSAGEWGQVHLLRLGPLWQTLLVELTLFCGPPTTTPTNKPSSTHAPTKPETTEATTVALTSPVITVDTSVTASSETSTAKIPTTTLWEISGPVVVPQN